MLKVGEIAYSNKLQSNVICVKDDFYNNRFGCASCCFDSNNHIDCISDLFTGDKFECRSRVRKDGKDVHFEIYEQD